MTDCPVLSKITAETIAITKELVYELIPSTYDRSPGSQVDVSCQFELELVGPSTVTCGNNGQWNGAPYCRAPPTTEAPSKSSGLDESTILLIVLVVVVVFVVAVIIVICAALYYGKRKRHREKSKTEASYYGEDSMPYSISDRHVTDQNNVAMYNYYSSPTQQHDNDAYRKSDSERLAYRNSDPVWTGYRRSDPKGTFDSFYRPQYNEHENDNHQHHPHDHNGDRKQFRMYRSHDDVTDDRNFRFQEQPMGESREPHVMRSRDDSATTQPHQERIYDRNPNMSRSPPGRRQRYKTKCPRCHHETELKHARSADDILSEEEYGRDGLERRGLGQDRHLWRSMNSISNWGIPRPYYGN